MEAILFDEDLPVMERIAGYQRRLQQLLAASPESPEKLIELATQVIGDTLRRTLVFSPPKALPKFRLTRNDRLISLSPTQAKILTVLINCEGEFISPGALSEAVWPKKTQTTDLSLLRVHLTGLRDRLPIGFVEVKRNIGYRIPAGTIVPAY